jgi:hypothetical protein
MPNLMLNYMMNKVGAQLTLTTAIKNRDVAAAYFQLSRSHVRWSVSLRSAGSAGSAG